MCESLYFLNIKLCILSTEIKGIIFLHTINAFHHSIHFFCVWCSRTKKPQYWFIWNALCSYWKCFVVCFQITVWFTWLCLFCHCFRIEMKRIKTCCNHHLPPPPLLPPLLYMCVLMTIFENIFTKWKNIYERSDSTYNTVTIAPTTFPSTTPTRRKSRTVRSRRRFTFYINFRERVVSFIKYIKKIHELAKNKTVAHLWQTISNKT